MHILSIKAQSPMTNGQFPKEENSFTRLGANEDSLCTSETTETVSQKPSWLTHSDPLRGERRRQQRIQSVGGSCPVSHAY